MWCRALVLAFGFGVSLGGGCDLGWLGRDKHPNFPAEAHGWQASGKMETFARRQLPEEIDSGRPLFLAYDFHELFVRKYTRPQSPTIVAEVFHTWTSEDAFGLFSHHRVGEDVGIGQANAYSAGRLCVWQGACFIRVAAERETPEARAAVLSIGRALARPVADGRMPRIPERLPTEGLDATSVRYLHTFAGLKGRGFLPEGSVLDLSDRTEAAMGTYRRDGETMALVVIRYKNRQQAEAARRSFRRAVLQAEAPPRGEPWVAARPDGRHLGAALQGRHLALVFEARTRPACEKLLGDASETLKRGS